MLPNLVRCVWCMYLRLFVIEYVFHIFLSLLSAETFRVWSSSRSSFTWSFLFSWASRGCTAFSGDGANRSWQAFCGQTHTKRIRWTRKKGNLFWKMSEERQDDMLASWASMFVFSSSPCPLLTPSSGRDETSFHLAVHCQLFEIGSFALRLVFL